MLHSKSTKIFSEITDFFTSSEKAITKYMSVMRTLKTTSLTIPNRSNWPTVYQKNDILNTLLLFAIFSIDNVPGYLQSTLRQYMELAKDTIYRFKNDSSIAWREIVYQLNKRIIRRIVQSGSKDNDQPACLIIDDTDMEKTGKFIEHVSRIWSHSQHRSMLGFKGLFLGYWDSKTFIGLDFSLHKEKGKNKKYPYGLRKNDLKNQYHKKRDKNSCGAEREKELSQDKVSNAIRMIQRAKTNKIFFEYVLMDSWFFCQSIMNAVRELGSHIIGMGKMGKTKYLFKKKNRSAKQIVDDVRRIKKVKRVKRLNLYVVDAIVKYKGVPVKLFFCRNTKRGKWHLLISTNTKLSILQAYQTYAIRWSIEVFFKETKQFFKLGKTQSRDFDAQIADTSICMLQYNIFSLAKRFAGYETMGGLFKDSKDAVMELTVCKRLWSFFMEFINIIADLCDIDPDELIEKISETDGDQNNKFIEMIKFTERNAA
jgi:hypothetical protein